MNEFIELINENDISTIQLIKRSFGAVKQNFKTFMKAGFSLIGIGLLVAIILSILAISPMMSGNPAMVMLGMLVMFIGTFGAIFLILGYSNKIGANVYYALIGKEEEYNGLGYYVKKSIVLYFVLSVVGGIIMSLVMFVFMLIYTFIASMFLSGIGSESGALYLFITLIGIGFAILGTVAFIAIFVVCAGIRFEYVVAGKDMSSSMEKSFKIFNLYKKDLLKKSFGIFLLFFAIIFVVGLILFFIVGLTGYTGITSMSYDEAYTIIAISGFILYLLSFVVYIFLAMYYDVLATGYYLNLSRREGYEIIGLNDTTNKPSNAQKASNEVETIKEEQQPKTSDTKENEVKFEDIVEQVQNETEAKEVQKVQEVQKVNATEVEVVKTEEVDEQ